MILTTICRENSGSFRIKHRHLTADILTFITTLDNNGRTRNSPANRLRAVRKGASNTGRCKMCFAPPKPPDRLWGPSILLFNRCRVLFHRGQSSRTLRATTQIRVPLRLKMSWNHNSGFHVCLHGLNRDNLTLP